MPEVSAAQHCQAGGRKDQSTGPPSLRGAEALGHHHAGSPEWKQLLAHGTAGQSSALPGQAEVPCPAFQGSQGKPTTIPPLPVRPGLQGLGCSWKIIFPRPVTSAAGWRHCSPHPPPCTQQSGEPSQTTLLQKTQIPRTGHGSWCPPGHGSRSERLRTCRQKGEGKDKHPGVALRPRAFAGWLLPAPLQADSTDPCRSLPELTCPGEPCNILVQLGDRRAPGLALPSSGRAPQHQQLPRTF